MNQSAAVVKSSDSETYVPVEVGAASCSRNVEEEEQILEAQLVPILVAPS